MKTTITPSRHSLSLFVLFFIFLATANAQIFTVICPDDGMATCEDDLTDLSSYGDAYIELTKGTIPMPPPTTEYNLDLCDVGTIERTWTTWYDKVIYSCTQVITVASTGLDVQNIVWPQDITLEECDPATDPEDLPTENSKPTYWSPPCSMVGANYSDQLYYIGSSCQKIVRTWTIINWCQYDGSGSGPGYFSYKQKIKLDKSEVPTYTCLEEIVGKTHNCDSGEIIHPALDIPLSSCGTGYDISNNSPYAYEDGADLSGIYPIGTTTVQYTIEYGCGNREFCYVDVIVEDTSTPIPYCIAKIHTALMPVDTDEDGVIDNGMVSIWAKDFDINTYDPCGNEFTPSFSPDEIIMSQTFTCNDVGENKINIYYISENGNASYCTVTLDVQNNDNIPDCEPVVQNDMISARISGEVLDVFDERKSEIVIECKSSKVETSITETIDTVTTHVVIDSFINASGNMVYHLEKEVEYFYHYDTLVNVFEEMHYGLTDHTGAFLFDSVTMHMDYELMAMDPEADMTSIDRCDLDVLVDHVLGEVLIDDPALLFAADLDDNGQVDFDDLRHMIFYLGGVTDELPYVHAYSIFPTTVENNFYNTTSSFLYTDLDTSMTQTNFIYILKGNLCQEPFSKFIKEEPMNILASISERLPLNFRSSVEAQLPKVYSEPAEFAFFPNPFSSSFVISVNNPKAQVIEIEVYNNNGKRVYRRSAFMDKGFHSLDNDLESQPAGIYFYQVKAGGSEFHGKAIKK